MEEAFPHLSVLKTSIIILEDVKIIFDQDCYHLHRATEYRQFGNAKPSAVQMKLG